MPHKVSVYFPDGKQVDAQGVIQCQAGAFAYYSRPRCSLTPAQERLTFWTLVVLSFGAASGFALQGYWLVLPFAGMEMGLLAWALETLRKREQDFESLVIQGDDVVLTWRAAGRDGQRTLNRHWVRVSCECSNVGRNCHLSVRSHGIETEIGHYLSDEARIKLAATLRNQLTGAH